MHKITWCKTSLFIENHQTAVSGGHQLQLQRCYREVSRNHREARHNRGNSVSGTPVLLLAGFLSDTSVFFPADADAGLAPFLAAAGFDVYVAQLRGKGQGWPRISRNLKAGVHQAIVEDIPAHLKQIAKLRPAQPQIWIGHEFGSVLLAGTFARLQQLPAPVTGMVHFAAGRRCELDSWRKTLAYRWWQWRCGCSKLLRGYVKRGYGANARRESRQMLADWQVWQRDAQWCDTQDGFDYHQAACQKGMPPSLYFAACQGALWGTLENTRQWIRELGAHDARLVGLGKAGGSIRNYNERTMVASADACADHFTELLQWLASRQELWRGAQSRYASGVVTE